MRIINVWYLYFSTTNCVIIKKNPFKHFLFMYDIYIYCNYREESKILWSFTDFQVLIIIKNHTHIHIDEYTHCRISRFRPAWPFTSVFLYFLYIYCCSKINSFAPPLFYYKCNIYTKNSPPPQISHFYYKIQNIH